MKKSKPTTPPIRRHPALQPLSRQHHHGLLMSWKIRQGLSKNIEPARIRKYMDWFYPLHLLPYFQQEEIYYFRILGEENAHVRQAVSEHRQLSELFEKAHLTQEELQQTAELLENHIRFEERILFKEVQEHAGPSDLPDNGDLETKGVFVENEEDPFWE